MDVWSSGTFPSKSRQLVHIVLQLCVECSLYALTTDIISTAIALFPRGLGTRLAQLVDEDVKRAM